MGRDSEGGGERRVVEVGGCVHRWLRNIERVSWGMGAGLFSVPATGEWRRTEVV